MQLCSKPRAACGIQPETLRRRGQRVSCPPTTGQMWEYVTCGGMQELSTALQRSESEQAHLRETLVRTEALIKQAKVEHEQDLQEAAAAARADLDALQRNAHDLQLAVRPPRHVHALAAALGCLNARITAAGMRGGGGGASVWSVIARALRGMVQVERERAARERADASVKEAQAALEQHKSSIEQSHAQGLKAAGALQSMKVPSPPSHRAPVSALSGSGLVRPALLLWTGIVAGTRRCWQYHA